MARGDKNGIKSKQLSPLEDSLVIAMLSSKSQREAYKKSDYASDKMKPETIDKRACTILARDHVARRLSELREKAIKQATTKSGFDKARVLKEIDDLLTFEITEIAELVTKEVPIYDIDRNVLYNKAGDVLTEFVQVIKFKDSSEWSDKAKKAVYKVGYNKFGPYVEMYNKQTTIKQAGDTLGMFIDKKEIAITAMPKIIIQRAKE